MSEQQSPWGRPDGADPGLVGARDPWEIGSGQSAASGPPESSPQRNPYEHSEPYPSAYGQTDVYPQPVPYARAGPAPSVPYGQPIPYGQPMVYGTYYGGYPMAPPTQDGLAIAALVTGIAGLIFFLFPVGIAALIMGVFAIRRTTREPMRYGGRGMGVAGVVLGGLSALATIVVVIIWAVIISAAQRSYG